ncbi:hypothetical protein AGLY_010406 [Aphis glycines]|uniref:Reverse transcriptase domain-containing protein n=1 Tax=Aphis glycines TaxID=307491 RepID=A0A6G0TET3_APHGL|nr:hypothetical protein AGLY_010406 [Aphis glycines]
MNCVENIMSEYSSTPFVLCGDFNIPNVDWLSDNLGLIASGDPSQVVNYKPISILPHIAKIFELIVDNCTKRSFNHVLIPHQHGFRPGKFTITSHGQQVDVIFTDFSEAFDTVDYGLPVNELESLEIGGHLSPMLFNLFVNSISNYVSRANLLLYADDIKIFHTIKAPDGCSLLHDELNKISDWVAHLGLSLNLRKRQIITFSRSRTPILNNYHINGAPLYRAFSIKDIGIH